MSPNKTPGSKGIIKTGKSANREDQSLQISFHFIHSFHQIFRFEFPGIFVCRMEQHFPPERTDLYPLRITRQMLKDCDKVAVTLSAVSWFM